MSPPPAFPAVIPPSPVLNELARAIRFFLGAKRDLLPDAASHAADWQGPDFPKEPHTGAVSLAKLLNAPADGGQGHLQWRQTAGEDALVHLLSIAWRFGGSAALRQLWDNPGHTLAGMPRATMRALGRKLVELADFMDTTGPDPHAGTAVPDGPRGMPNGEG